MGSKLAKIAFDSSPCRSRKVTRIQKKIPEMDNRAQSYGPSKFTLIIYKLILICVDRPLLSYLYISRAFLCFWKHWRAYFLGPWRVLERCLHERFFYGWLTHPVLSHGLFTVFKHLFLFFLWLEKVDLKLLTPLYPFSYLELLSTSQSNCFTLLHLFSF